MQTTNLIKTTLKTLLLSLSLSQPLWAEAFTKQVAITQFVEHVAADAVREGLLAELAKRSYTDGKNITVEFENAQGNATTAGQIARKFLGLKPDVIVAITTPSAQVMVKTIGNNTIPIVFSAVTDPLAAGLVSSLDHHKEKVTGVRDAPPIKEQIEFIKTLLPKAKTIGVLYNPGDNGSVASLEIIHKQAKAQGLTVVEATPMRSSEVQAAVLQLIGKVDAIYVPLDNMLVSAMQTVASLALRNDVPLFSADSESVKAGALACLGYSYSAVGTKTGAIVADILEGKDPAEITVASPDTKDIFINRQALEKLKITLPEGVRKEARFY